MTKFSLDKHIILITGASSGIGRSCAVEASRMGATCILTGRNEEELKRTAGLCSTPATIFSGDLTALDVIQKLVSGLPKLDGVIHCAGITHPWPIKFLKPEHIKTMFDINYTAPVLLTTELLQKNKINDDASFIFISSISAQHPYYGGATYASSKAAIEAFSKSLAIEMAPRRVRSNVIRPGLVKTRMFDEAKGASVDSENFDQYEKFYPLGFGEAEDVSNAACYLLSKESRWITGTEIKMDGGLILNSKKN
ncbi:MAG: SDR family oxidoreductase [Bacteroidetes bacterium]|nr:SDR family oxidoreductase [Bacteroidota bacterium]